MEEIKISVIIPVYKVESYLSKCLDSVLNQTHKNLEIILVDDGSPDHCGEICDNYAARDNRIQVIHKSNGGVSSARNAGLAVATGEWIGWVDSDDWIEPDMYEYLLKGVLENKADIAVCSRYEEFPDQQKFKGWKQKELLDTEKALELLLRNQAMQNYLWDKLWRRELFNGLTFPEGKTFEDVMIMHHLFARAHRVVCLPLAKYHYLQHPDSIVGNSSLTNKINYYTAAQQRYQEMKDKWPQFSDLMEAQCVFFAISVWCSYYSNPREMRKKYRPQIKEIAAFSKAHTQTALRLLDLGITGRAIMYILPYASWWSFLLARFFSWAYKIKHGRAL